MLALHKVNVTTTHLGAEEWTHLGHALLSSGVLALANVHGLRVRHKVGVLHVTMGRSMQAIVAMSLVTKVLTAGTSNIAVMNRTVASVVVWMRCRIGRHSFTTLALRSIHFLSSKVKGASLACKRLGDFFQVDFDFANAFFLAFRRATVGLTTQVVGSNCVEMIGSSASVSTVGHHTSLLTTIGPARVAIV